jgi:hypothetical protein
LLRFVEAVSLAQRKWGSSAPNLEFALDAVEDIIYQRAQRLSLENSGIPSRQYDVLRSLGVALIFSYAYLTLDGGIAISQFLRLPPDDMLVLPNSDASFGVRALFASLCGAVNGFYNLSLDFNFPFSRERRSATVVATANRIKNIISQYFDPNEKISGFRIK